ncbi:type II toxin-antitoxin system mRNA interferase toxin, RelE/StbE family [bacterium]|nr:type II toxin-antitoxin system mRNA interferase toxin, RelE/StbE family [bacterium]
MKIRYTESFKSDYSGLDDKEIRQTKAKFALLIENLFHPSLRVKKMKGKPGQSGIYRMRVTSSLRITFTIDDDIIILRRVGKHDDTTNKP